MADKNPFDSSSMETKIKVGLEWWNKVEKTDPKYTKQFSRAGGFKGTATNMTYLVKKATELWGPAGGAWGYEVVDEKYVPGALLKSGEHSVVHVLRIKLRHPHGCVEHFGQTTFIGQNSNGTYTDEEAPKKSLTDALSKCLAMLGFAADVHLGLYDDNKYVTDLRKEFADAAEDEPEREGAGKGDSQGSLAVDAEFLAKLDAAASQGIAPYRKVWEGGTPAQRKSCAGKHELLKTVALKNTPDEQKPAK